MIYFIICVVVLILISLIFFLHRKKRAIKRTICSTREEKISYIDVALEAIDFKYDFLNDTLVAKKNSWLQELGYTDWYDLNAPLFKIVIDSEPIFFEYDGKEYRIEFWKGQYGITTGAEVGIYVRDEKNFKKWDFYNAVDEHEFLEVCFSLYKDCLLFSREERTWWLTGFAIGEYSWPSELVMKVCVHFPNLCMRNAFIDGLLKSGYKRDKINCCGNYVCFDYCRPYNYKLNHRCRILKFFVQCMNKVNCSIYMFITRPFNTTLDKLTYLRFLAPTFYKFILHLSIPKRKHKKYQRKIKKMTARQ